MIFELSWSWYEDYVPYLFEHPTKTHEEFIADVKALLKKYGPAYLAKSEEDKHFIGAQEWIKFTVPLFEELGYKAVLPKRFDIFGTSAPIGVGYGDDSLDDDELEFGKIVGMELLEKAVAANKRIDAQLQHRRS